MKKIVVLLVLVLLLVGCENANNKGNSDVNNRVDTTTNTSTNTQKPDEKYVIKKEDIDEQEFIIDPEVDVDGSMECHLFFMNEHAYYSDGFGNVIRGEYAISGDILSIDFRNYIGDYSEKPQELDVDVTIKMTNENTMEVVETPNTYILKTSNLVDGKWVFDGGEKEMELFGFVKGYHFYKVPTVSKIDASREWVYDAEYEKNLKAPSYVVDGKIYSGDSIVVPYINIDSDYAREVNTEIKNVFDKIIEHYNNGIEDNMSYVDSCNYTVFTEENGLFVLFTYGLGATDVVHPVYFTYNFNLVDGSKLDFDYFCNYIGREKDEVESSVIKKIEEIFKAEMNEFDAKEIESYLNSTKSSFEEAFNNGKILFTITEDRNPAFVVDIQTPAGTGHFDTLIEI